jgi:hypothetical protein
MPSLDMEGCRSNTASAAFADRGSWSNRGVTETRTGASGPNYLLVQSQVPGDRHVAGSGGRTDDTMAERAAMAPTGHAVRAVAEWA